MNKLKILFILGRFYPTPSANTINTENIIKELQNRGHEITCIAINQDENEPFKNYRSFPVYSIESTRYGRLLQLRKEGKLSVLGKLYYKILLSLRKLSNVINLSKFPDVDPSQSKKVFKLADKLHKNENFDCVIGVFRPFSSVSAAISLKRKYPKTLCGAYYLDLISGATKPSLIPDNIYRKLSYEGELRAFSEIDFILMAKGGENIYSDDKYKSVNSKIRYIDFPVFIPVIKEKSKHFKKINDNEKIILLYAGTLDRYYRDPTYMFEILNKLGDLSKQIVLHIYGRNNCSHIIRKYKNQSTYEIIEHGIVPHDEIKIAMEQSDFLLNISNKTQNIVPSKIFELFSTGKPIINILSNKDDISVPYFSKYPSVCMLSELNDSVRQTINLKNFMLRERGKQYNANELKDKYLQNTPEYTADLIEECIRSQKEKCYERT